MSAKNSTIYEFTLSPDNPSNTTISDQEGRVVYKVETVFPGSKTITQVRDANGDVLAALEWREFRSDRVTRGRGKEIALSDWLKKSMIAFNSSVSFEDDKKRKYKWKGCGSGEQMQLFAEDFSSTDPIAKFVRPSRRSSEPARLVLCARALEIQEDVVLSFLFLEKSRRSTEASTQHKADVLGMEGLSIGLSTSQSTNNGELITTV